MPRRHHADFTVCGHLVSRIRLTKPNELGDFLVSELKRYDLIGHRAGRPDDMA